MALREQMAALQMMRMKQDMQQQYLQNRAGGLYGNITRAAPGGDPLSRGPGGGQMTSPGAYAQAELLERAFSPTGGAIPMKRQMAEAMDWMGPQLTQQGLMQTGQLLSQPGGARQVVQTYDQPAVLSEPRSGLRLGPDFPGTIRGATAAAGGRVPSTGTYKLHKGEVVVPKKAADVLFPYVAKGEEQKKLKAKGKYPPDYELRFRARKGKIKDSYQFGSPGMMQRPEIARALAMSENPMRARSRLEMLADVLGQPVEDVVKGLQKADVPDLGYLLEPVPPQMGAPMETPPRIPMETMPVPLGPSAAPQAPAEAPTSSGYIEYAGPGRGGMTQFGVEGKLDPERLKNATLTDWHKNLPTPSQMAEHQTAADIAKRGADFAASRADILHEYQDQQSTPSPELDAKIKQWDRSRQRYEKRAQDFQTKADTLRAQGIAQDIQMIETQGRIAEAQLDAMGEAGEAQASRFEFIQDAVADAMKEAGTALDAGKTDKAHAVLQGAIAPLLAQMPDKKGFTEEDLNATLSIAIQNYLSDPRDPERTAALLSLISMVSGGRLGG
jgi:hypothetical protein